MLNQIFRIVLLVALLSAFVASSASAFDQTFVCLCLSAPGKQVAGCEFDQKVGQCINKNCAVGCFLSPKQ
jgi:hypothetical protein